MRRRELLLATALMGLVIVPGVPAAASPAAPRGWSEGFHLAIDPSINCGIQGGGFKIAAIDATKTFDGWGHLQSSRFELFLEAGGHVPTFTISAFVGPQVFDVPIDPDYLSVSSDLGWAGLDASVVGHDAVSAADVPRDIHLSVFAVTGSQHVDGVFERTALPASDFLDIPFSERFTDEFGVTAPIGTVLITTVPFRLQSFLTACPLNVTIFSTRAPTPTA
jgi:hypothetical protein